MGRLALAFSTFFKILTDSDTAERIRTSQSPALPAATESPAPKPAPPEEKITARSDALTLLETLQREARLLDFLQEDLTAYQDAQVGAAVREVHRGSADVIKRCFAIEATVQQAEETPFEVTTSTNLGQVRLTGNVVESRPVTGTLVHSGWKATKCELPKWSGEQINQFVLAPAEVELT